MLPKNFIEECQCEQYPNAWNIIHKFILDFIVAALFNLHLFKAEDILYSVIYPKRGSTFIFCIKDSFTVQIGKKFEK